MTKNLQKLELTWIGKGDEPKLEPRILLENPEYSYGDPHTDNMLIHGDNLLALKALEQDYAGKIKCIYIDPPYNTGSAFEHYDDGIEHSLWLSLIKPRLTILRNLLSQDGSIWISIDDNECHYLKVLCDEVFGRSNFVANVIWQKKFSPQNDAKWISNSHDHILCFAKEKSVWRPNPLPRSESMDERFKNPDNDPKGPWASTDLTRAEHRDRDFWGLITPSGKEVFPAKGRSWSRPFENIEKLKSEGRLWFGPNGDRMPRLKKYLSEMDGGLTPQTIWLNNEVGNTQEAKKEVLQIGAETVFATPKPERLIYRILHVASNPGDLVLDSFLGSGTTVAVAQKMHRRWIGVELGDHAKTHCYPRLKAVVDGDLGGISKSVGWKGGGGFKFYTLAPSLLKEDRFGNWIISPEYNADRLAAAMAKQEGFRYQPHESIYWKQGQSSERDFIFTTTQFLTMETLDRIHDEMRPGETLLLCCKAYQKETSNKYLNISIKKIPQMLMGRCEFGKEDYSLNIINLPADQENLEYEEIENISVQQLAEKSKKAKSTKSNQPGLFD